MRNDQRNMFPYWYWQHGLHDARITDAEKYDFPTDYNIYHGKKSNAYKNLLRLRIDASHALYDTTVTEIRFFNYEILSGDIDWQKHRDIWWLGDILTKSGTGYLLEIDLQILDAAPEKISLLIQFDFAEVKKK